MTEILSFFKEIFMLKEGNSKVGLCQFKCEEEKKVVEKPVKKVEKEVKLSDLMRRSA